MEPQIKVLCQLLEHVEDQCQLLLTLAGEDFSNWSMKTVASLEYLSKIVRRELEESSIQ